MLSLKNIRLHLGGRAIIEECNFNLMDGWKAGLVGANGAGKTSLFKLITHEFEPDGGSITLSPNQKIGIVAQNIPECENDLLSVVMQADKELFGLLKDSETCEDPEKLGDIHMRLAELDGYRATSRAAILLSGLGFKEAEMKLPFSSFSGGWRMRVALAGALFMQPDLLLLDEPTNHLDLEAIMWLENYLKHYPYSLLVISHDREFLNNTISHILHIDQKAVTHYSGNYDSFERERAAKLGLQQKMHEKQQREREHLQSFIDRFKAKATKARQAQSRIKALERMDIIDAVIINRAVQFKFPNPNKLAPELLRLEDAKVGYEAGKPILSHLNLTIDENDRIALLGTNGSGKSTLMKLIAGKLAPMAGDIGLANKLKIGYFDQHQRESLQPEYTPFEILQNIVTAKKGDGREAILRAKLGQFGFNKSLSDTKIAKLSGGEKSRLLFAFMSLDAPHILLLDEPTNHLDIEAREALIQALNQYQGAVVMVSHDPNMLERAADQLWLVQGGKCQNFDGDLQDYRRHILQSRSQERMEQRENKSKPAKKQQANNTKTPEDLNHKDRSAMRNLRKKSEKYEARLAKLADEIAIITQKQTLPQNLADGALQKTLHQAYETLHQEQTHLEADWLQIQVQLET